ncbi:unnamed protein product [Nippostrongylus brasiliensis]|uniref:Transmembrane protein 129 (inferred by orthology to a human protein) n=1 Tax=Nippostrongylus brasiliensis TaxID=27835 RepID=A0A0N4XF10_NIPBR|nr:unnamed protein product [Nippostrongylus brasiliensis]
MTKQAHVLIILSTLCLIPLAECRTLTEDEWNTLQTTYVLPNSAIFFHAALFTAIVLLLLYPPDAFVGAGLTFDNLACGYLGSPELNLLEFHCRRVVLTRALVACLPYCGLIYIVYNTMTRFRRLYAMKVLKNYGYDTQQVFATLSSEFLRIEAFSHAISNVSKIIITDSFLFYCSRFQFVVAKLADVQFRVVNAEDTLNRLHHALGMNQYLTIAVSLPAEMKSLNFEFKIDNVSMRDLEGKLGADRIEFSSEVRLKMSLTDKFIEAFIDQAKKNPRFTDYVREDLDFCLGCSEKLPNVKLLRKCHDIDPLVNLDEHHTPCTPCQCRPMWSVWCVSCMARIFLAKQDQSSPTTWLVGTCACPTCRYAMATFCIMDVALLSHFDLETEEETEDLKSEEE